MRRSTHVGADAFIEQRAEMLNAYDSEKAMAVDDPLRVAHGIAGENIVRRWLKEFLPKRFGVTKGFVITHNRDYDDRLQEWDIIIYDRLESPILFVRRWPEKRRAIPVEYVRAIVEVKATLTLDSAQKMREKLERLKPFCVTNVSERYPQSFDDKKFLSTGIFFETAVKDAEEFTKALDELCPLVNSVGFGGALVLRSHTNPQHAGSIESYCCGEESPPNMPDFSSWLRDAEGMYHALGCHTWSINAFSDYVFGLILSMRGMREVGRAPSFYGQRLSEQASHLFPPPAPAPEANQA